MKIEFEDFLKEIRSEKGIIEQLDDIFVQSDYTYEDKYKDILNFLNNPNYEISYFLLAKKFLDIEFTNDDILEYLCYRDDKLYTKIVTIPIDEVVLEQIFDDPDEGKFVHLYNLVIKCACDDSFKIETRNYTVDEIKELVSNNILCPIEKEYTNFTKPLNTLKNIKVYQKELDELQYLDKYPFKESKKDHDLSNEYFKFFVNKIKQGTTEKTLMIYAGSKISELYLDILNGYYEEVYWDRADENIKKKYINDSKKIQILIEKYNNYASSNGLESISGREIDAFLDNVPDILNINALSAYLDLHELTIEDAIKLKYSCRFDDDLIELFKEYVDTNALVNKIIMENDEKTALRCLVEFNYELDFLTKCKLLRVILNSGNKEVIDLVVEDGLLSESNVKKYINKRK